MKLTTYIGIPRQQTPMTSSHMIPVDLKGWITAPTSFSTFPYVYSHSFHLSISSHLLQDDIKGLDIEKGECVNSSVTQNVEFGYQNLPFDEGSDSAFTLRAAWSLIIPGFFALLVAETFL
jgi:hypothetical protein